MFAQQVGAKMTHIPYKGAGPAVTDLVAGRVDMFNTPLILAAPRIVLGPALALAQFG
jgi:tripartite-type tricarboxylate transporter receptor subunit TctC